MQKQSLNTSHKQTDADSSTLQKAKINCKKTWMIFHTGFMFQER